MKNILSTIATLCACSIFFTLGAETSMKSPDASVQASLILDQGNLSYSVSFLGKETIAPSCLGVIVDKDTLGTHCTSRGYSQKEIYEKYPTRGFHTEALNHCNEYTYELTSRRIDFRLQFRLYNDGVAFRYVIPTKQDSPAQRIVHAELSSFHVPGGIPVWFFERPNDWKLKTYAGKWGKTVSDSLYCISPTGPVQGPILLYELGNERYMAITEAALYNYSGMRLKAQKDCSLQVNFTETEGFGLTGTITTPWRVIILTQGLNDLVNTDMITNLNPAPDPRLFPSTDWIKPGRSVWSWWSEAKGYMTPKYEKKFIDMAAELGFEYTTIDEGWETQWTDKWKQLREICEYAASKKVKVFVWKHSETINNPDNDYAVMRNFIDSVAACGAAGVKIDFMNSESKRTIDFDTKALQLCAERQLLVNFHGCQKPTGEFRTYPNEITREGVRGLELNKLLRHIPANHNVALIFTRGILNNNDYTPVGFSNPGNTTWTHQLATAYAFTSPLITIAEHPHMLLHDKRLKTILPFLKELPSTWDETLVLPGSDIDKTALLARRKGQTWYLIALNGSQPLQLPVKTDFLLPGKWEATIIADGEQPDKTVQHIRHFDSGIPLDINMAANGGFVAKITPAP